LASLVALDRAYFKRQGLPANALAGVISISGLYISRLVERVGQPATGD